MPHNNAKHHPEGAGVKLITTPIELVSLMIPGVNERQIAIDQIDNEGPEHKQVFSALLLNRLNKMVRTMEKSTGTPFLLKEGYQLSKKKGSVDIVISVPINVGNDLEKKQIADAISHAPEHEALVYAMCLQAVEWTITAA